MPGKVRDEYTKNMTTEIDKRAQLKYAREHGRAEGREKGNAEAREEMARAMLKDGLDVSVVAKYSGLKIEQVKAL